MRRRLARGQPATDIVQIKPGVAVLAQWRSREEWAKGKCVEEKTDPSLGQMFLVQYCQDQEKEWLLTKHVKARGEATEAPQMTSPETRPAPKKAQAKRKIAQKKKEPPKKPRVEEVPEESEESDIEKEKETVVVSEEEVQPDSTEKPPEQAFKKIPFIMGDSGRVSVPTMQAYALSEDLTTEMGFQGKRVGFLGKLQVAALDAQVPAERGFSAQSPFYDILNRGHKLVRNDDVGKIKYLNLLNSTGLKYTVQYINYKGTQLTFSNVRVATHHAETEVCAIC